MKNEKVQRKLETGMTAAQLIEELKNVDPDAIVLFACDYGDYHHTQQALPVSEVEERDASDLADSAYSQSGIALNDDDGEPEWYCDPCDEMRTVPTCPKCNAKCVDEDGDVYDPDNDDDSTVIILG